jgi:hypothetical protein
MQTLEEQFSFQRLEVHFNPFDELWLLGYMVGHDTDYSRKL